MMRDINDLLVHVLPYAPNAPEPAILKQLRDVSREFCSAGRMWHEDDSFTVAAPDFEALVTIPDCSIVAIEQARFDDNGRPLTPITVKELDGKYRDWRTDTDTSTARYITQLQPNSVTIYPRQIGLLNFGLILQPSLEAQLLPDWLIEQHGAQLGKGAAGRLLTLPNTEFANPSLGSTLINEWNGYSAKKATSAPQGQHGARRRVAGSFF